MQNDDDDGVEVGRDVGQVAGGAAFGLKPLNRCGDHVKPMHPVARPQGGLGDAIAHGAKAKDSNFLKSAHRNGPAVVSELLTSYSMTG